MSQCTQNMVLEAYTPRTCFMNRAHGCQLAIGKRGVGIRDHALGDDGYKHFRIIEALTGA